MTGASKAVVGIDIGGSGVRMQVGIGEQREAVRQFAFGDNADPESAMRVLEDWCSGVRPAAAGIAAAATLNGDGTVSRWPGRPGWVGVPLVQRISAMLKCPVLAKDDGTLAALAEARARAAESLIYLGLGTGVGGGIVADGQLLDGAHGAAGEFGHLQIPGVSAQCACGRVGCLQAVAAWPAFCARVAFNAKKTLTTAQVMAAIDEGKPAALQALAACSEAVALALVNLQEAFDPAALVIGGGFHVKCPRLVTLIDAATRRMRRAGTAEVPVEHAHYGARSSLEGAIILARSHLEHDT